MAARQAALKRAWRIVEEKRTRKRIQTCRSSSDQPESIAADPLIPASWREPQRSVREQASTSATPLTSPLSLVKNHPGIDFQSLHRGRGLPVGQGRGVSSNEAFSWQPTTHPPLPSFPLILPVQAPVSEVWLSKFQKIEEGLQWIKDEKDKSVDVKIKALEDQVNALNGLYHDGYDDRPSNIRDMPENLDSPISSMTDSTMFTKEDLAASKRKHSNQEDIKLLQMIRIVLGKKEEATSSQVNGSSHAPVHAIANQKASQPTTIPAVANGVIHDSAALQPIDRRKSSDPIQTARNVREASPFAIQEVNALQTRRFDITIHVAGAGIDAVNGEYRQISQGSVFVQVHTSNHIMRVPSFGMNNEKWIICDVVGTFETERDAMIEAVYYR